MLDSDVANLYGVGTKRINEAVKITLINSHRIIYSSLVKWSLQICGRKSRLQNFQRQEYKSLHRKAITKAGVTLKSMALAVLNHADPSPHGRL